MHRPSPDRARAVPAQPRRALCPFAPAALCTLIVAATAVGQDLPVRQIQVDTGYLSTPHCKAMGDITGNGKLDLIAAGSTYRGATSGVIWYEHVAIDTWVRHLIAPTGENFSTDAAVSDIDQDGDLDVIAPVQNSPDEIWWFENPRPTGNPRTPVWNRHFIGNNGSHDVLVADVNGDGKPDVVTARGTISYFQQITPQSWAEVNIGTANEGISLGDLDGDGDRDIIAGGRWWEAPADPVAQPWVEHSYDNSIHPNWTLWNSHVADVDNDGRPDILLAPGDSAADGKVRVYLAPPDPRTSPWPAYVTALQNSGHNHGIQTADMDRDGDLDIVTSEMEQSPTRRVLILFNQGGRGLAWRPQVLATAGSHNIQIGDIDADGDVDVYGSNHGNRGGDVKPYVWQNELIDKPLDVWQRHLVDGAVPARAVFVRSGDLDGDGFVDIAAAGYWWKNPGRLADPWTRQPIGSPLNTVALVSDLDGDNDLDIFGTQGVGSTANSSLAWAENDGSGGFTVHTNIQSGGWGDFLQGVALADFGSGRQIAMSWHNGGGGVHAVTIPADPVGTSWPFTTLSTTTQSEDLSVGDIDRDGDPDLLLGTIWLRNDLGSWSSHTLGSVPSGVPDRNSLADVNRNGRLDAIVALEAGTEILLFEAPADPTQPWTRTVIANVAGQGFSMDAADMDWDGDIDVVVGEHKGSSQNRVLLLEGTGSVANWPVHVVDSDSTSVIDHHDGTQLVDLDGDGDLDMISTGWFNPKIWVYENRAILPPPGSNPRSVTAAFEAGGGLGGFGVKSGSVRPANGSLDLIGSTRLVLPGRRYSDVTAIGQFGANQALHTETGFLLRASHEDDSRQADGSQIHVAVRRRNTTPGDLDIELRDRTGVLLTRPLTGTTAATPYTLEVIIAGDNVKAWVNTELGIDYTGLRPGPALGGYTSLISTEAPGTPGWARCGYVLVREANSIPDSTLDANGQAWWSLCEPGLFSRFLPQTFFVTWNGFPIDLWTLIRVTGPRFHIEGFGNDWVILSLRGIRVPRNVSLGLYYAGQLEIEKQRRLR